jgi:hypothetical protein
MFRTPFSQSHDAPRSLNGEQSRMSVLSRNVWVTSSGGLAPRKMRWKKRKKEKSEGQAQVKDSEKNLSEQSSIHSHEHDKTDIDISEIREKLLEQQGRVWDLGREMAKPITSP